MPTNPTTRDPEPSQLELESAAGARTAARGRPEDFELEVTAGKQAQENQLSRLQAEQEAGAKAANQTFIP